MIEPITVKGERIRQAAKKLCAEAEHVGELTRAKILELAGGNLGRRAFDNAFPGDQFTRLRQSWLLNRIETAMNTLFATARVQRDVTIQKVADLAGCSPNTVRVLAGDSWRARTAVLDDSQERVRQAIQRLVAARIPLREYTWARVYAEADERPLTPSDETGRAFRDGLETLIRYHEQQNEQRIPGAAYACIQGHWVNVDEESWFLPSRRKTIRRDRLRADIAAIAWPLLRDEALTTPNADSLYSHYSGCINVARLLGDSIPDIRDLSLDALQRAWLRFDAANEVRKHLRPMLVRMLEVLIVQGVAGASIDVQEYARALNWLQSFRVKMPAASKAFLSEAEFDALLDGCLDDIVLGLAYTERSGPAVGQTTSDVNAEGAVAVLHWGVALIVLVMAFTGLRRQSIVRLTVEDIAQIGPQVFALTWRHGKPAKEGVAIIPALVAEHIQHYIKVTSPVRARLNTNCIFFARNRSMHWDHMTDDRLDTAFVSFDYRHPIKRDSVTLRLGSTLLRRTYATRALYEFPSVAALQAQLGHSDQRSTLGYAQRDHLEHPARVGGALDVFGRRVLVRWRTPLLLDDLPSAERQVLLGVRVAREQDVGMCRHCCCVKLSESNLPPCSLCEHLVTGPEYLDAWEREDTQRKQQLERLANIPGAQVVLAQMKGQYNHFQANYRLIRERCQA